MDNAKVLQTWGDENGDLFRVGRNHGRYYIETIVPAWEPRAGEVARRYVSKEEAEGFDPDPMGELEFWSAN